MAAVPAPSAPVAAAGAARPHPNFTCLTGVMEPCPAPPAGAGAGALGAGPAQGDAGDATNSETRDPGRSGPTTAVTSPARRGATRRVRPSIHPRTHTPARGAEPPDPPSPPAAGRPHLLASRSAAWSPARCAAVGALRCRRRGRAGRDGRAVPARPRGAEGPRAERRWRRRGPAPAQPRAGAPRAAPSAGRRRDRPER